MRRKQNSEGKFNGKYMDFCDEFDPSEAKIRDTGGGEWNNFEVPENEPEHVAKPNKDVDPEEALSRAKASKIGLGILSAMNWAR